MIIIKVYLTLFTWFDQSLTFHISIVNWIQSPMIEHTEFRDELIKQFNQQKISKEQMLKLGNPENSPRFRYLSVEPYFL